MICDLAIILKGDDDTKQLTLHPQLYGISICPIDLLLVLSFVALHCGPEPAFTMLPQQSAPFAESPSSSTAGARAPPPPSRSACPAKSHTSLAVSLGKTARDMAARRRNIAIWISWLQRLTRRPAETCCPLRWAAMSAAYRSVRVTAACGRPSAVHTSGRNEMPACLSSTISFW